MPYTAASAYVRTVDAYRCQYMCMYVWVLCCEYDDGDCMYDEFYKS